MTNRAILEGLKRRVVGLHGMWVNKLLNILWASQITPKTTMGESPFSLVFGTKAMLPPEVVFPTPQIKNFKEGASKNGLCANLNLIKE